MKYDRILPSPSDSSPGLVGCLIFGGLNRAGKRDKGARTHHWAVGGFHYVAKSQASLVFLFCKSVCSSYRISTSHLENTNPFSD